MREHQSSKALNKQNRIEVYRQNYDVDSAITRVNNNSQLCSLVIIGARNQFVSRLAHCESALKRLVTLSLHNMIVDEPLLRNLSIVFSSTSNLTGLSLTQSAVTPTAVTLLTRYLQSAHVAELDLDGTLISDEQLATLLRAVLSQPRLRALSLRGVGVGKQSMNVLLEYLKNQSCSIVDLSLANNPIPLDQLNQLLKMMMSNQSSLMSIDLRNLTMPTAATELFKLSVMLNKKLIALEGGPQSIAISASRKRHFAHNKKDWLVRFENDDKTFDQECTRQHWQQLAMLLQAQLKQRYLFYQTLHPKPESFHEMDIYQRWMLSRLKFGLAMLQVVAGKISIANLLRVLNTLTSLLRHMPSDSKNRVSAVRLIGNFFAHLLRIYQPSTADYCVLQVSAVNFLIYCSEFHHVTLTIKNDLQQKKIDRHQVKNVVTYPKFVADPLTAQLRMLTDLRHIDLFTHCAKSLIVRASFENVDYLHPQAVLLDKIRMFRSQLSKQASKFFSPSETLEALRCLQTFIRDVNSPPPSRWQIQLLSSVAGIEQLYTGAESEKLLKKRSDNLSTFIIDFQNTSTSSLARNSY